MSVYDLMSMSYREKGQGGKEEGEKESRENKSELQKEHV